MRDIGGGSGEPVEFRPLSVGELLDAMFHVYRQQFLTFVTIVCTVAVPTSLVELALAVANNEPGYGLIAMLLGEPYPASDESLAGSMADLAVSVISWGTDAIARGAATLVVANVLLGQTTGVLAAYSQTLRRALALIWMEALYFLAVFGLIATCLGIPFAILVGVGWSVSVPALLLERRRATDALRRSWALTAGHRWRLFACLFVGFLLLYLLATVPPLLFEASVRAWNMVSLNNPPPTLVIQVGDAFARLLATVLVTPLSAILLTMLYYDLRVRKEAFDLEFRSITLPPTRLPPAPPDVSAP